MEQGSSFIQEEANGMTEKEQATLLIKLYTDLQRIKNAVDRDSEIDYQIATTKAQLQTLGITTENLDLNK